jgi:uncharacterized protein YheU (UPF0270 family)
VDDKTPQPPMEVPRDVLSEEAFQGIIESFILREGTDYGAEEVSLGTKIHQIEKQLDKGDIKIVFDPDTESVSLVTLTEWRRISKRS